MNKIISLDQYKYRVLKDYLQRHEDDIATDINDYSDLYALFMAVLERKPEAEGE